MQVFVINLATATDRLAYMSEQLDGAFERIEAVRGRSGPAHLQENFVEPTPLLPGEIGCYTSHLVVAETILARGLPYAVVLEDDVELASNFRANVEKAIALIRDDWDIVSLSGAKQHPHCPVAPVSDSRNLVRYLHFPKTTAAYVISQSGCRKLLQQRRRMRPVDVDIRYGWEMELDGYGVFPPPAAQTGRFASSIPKSRKQRFYWRADPLGYLMGRIAGARRLGLINLMRAYLQETRLRRSSMAD
ncbi:MAG: glycosyltransferase family 25 protein [Hyphomicrobium sp.]|jgi:glycosyl transferase family 25